eukprot:9032753-Ditylum_brightwellii.AAC.1
MERSEFVVVTDGSVGEFGMLFGWKICALSGENIAERAALSFFRRAMEYTTSTKSLKGMGNFVPTILHIHGHQDKHKKYNDLSLPVKLNVGADLLAVEY